MRVGAGVAPCEIMPSVIGTPALKTTWPATSSWSPPTMIWVDEWDLDRAADYGDNSYDALCRSMLGSSSADCGTQGRTEMADVVPVPRFTARWLTIISAPVTIAAVLAAAPACQADWAYGRYLYRYFVWGPHQLAISGVDDYKLFPYRTIDNGLPAFYFRTGPADTIPARVEYKDGETVKAAGLEELLKSTSTHAFIVIKDDKLLYEHYFNGYQRDSICVSMSMAKSVTSALVGIAIDEGLIRSVNDPLTDYIPELKERGFGAITIRHLLTMGSGIKFTEHAIDFVWSDDALAYFHPYLRERLLSDLTIVEPPGEAFHYNSYNPELLGLILEQLRAVHRANTWRGRSGSRWGWSTRRPGASTVSRTGSS